MNQPYRVPVKSGRLIKFALVSPQDECLVRGKKWHASNAPNGKTYVYHPFKDSNGKWRKVALHRLLTKPKENENVDHINGDTLDNRRENLRTATHSQNQHNKGPCKNTSSKYKGVSWDKNNQRWKAGIRSSGKSYHLGSFTSEVWAAVAYDKAALKYHAAFARTNFPKEIVAELEKTNV